MADEARWHALWAHHEAALGAARRRSPSIEDAEDALMDALIRCAEYPKLDETRAGPFLMTVTRNACVDAARSRRRRENARYALVDSSDGGFEDDVCAAAEARWLVARVAALPDRERAAVAGRAAGRSFTELATEWAATPRAVESALTRARRKLHRIASTADVRGR